MKVFFASDHAGFTLKNQLKAHLSDVRGFEVDECGAFEHAGDDDYPDFVHAAALAVQEDPDNRRAVVLGGSGQGEAMVANRHGSVRAALFYGPVAAHDAVEAEGTNSDDPFAIVKLTRRHNDANVLSLGARFLTTSEAKRALDIFLDTPFSDGERHVRRIGKIEPDQHD